ncbi:protein lin-37 homolog [Cylas formicarius]|uniref:protein lin-37 homolog n=1 Tax=Cylas formicarius TaxID=197179 RepID=UPI00295848D5|nr:protein lin-37 homolog [Cylas formicarius]
MTKKRKLSSSSPVKIEIKEENVGANDYLMAKGRLQGVLKQLRDQTSSDDSDSSEDAKAKPKTETKKKKVEPVPVPYHHTYVMKLYDRSVDLARFEEDTPLYPLCRAWMENQPKNPQPIIKRRVSSPEPDGAATWNGDAVDVSRLPPPSRPFQARIPSPLPEQEQIKERVDLNYDESPPIDKDVLMKGHLQRWVKVKRKWFEAAQENDERYAHSFSVLQSIYNKAQENLD